MRSVEADGSIAPGDSFSFRRVEGELQQAIPLLKEHWVLAFRALVQTTYADGEQVVPYYLLATLGGARMHRGYSGPTLKGMVSLGLYIPSFHFIDYPNYPSVGRFSADRFNPRRGNLACRTPRFGGLAPTIRSGRHGAW